MDPLREVVPEINWSRYYWREGYRLGRMIKNGTLPTNMIGRQNIAWTYESAKKYEESAYDEGLALALGGLDLDNLFAETE